ncbi:UbiA family prenyltransferase [Haloarchaeobius sp. HME9146]|uniref:UbiA family prenyltransferase n=1 Tax=Haloarchaeobius sp. HME9146 TaxID=2978732 RepID=UPI0021BE8013|nr:UbiA family prenyltransferase [Haloarchaeobius sp. HME9146]MCT9096025.1 UbiA family prenyltransferase [Haloarchaeobius sp. HME9146]
MTFSRHGSGLRADAQALASQVHPVFMLPPIAASWFGSILAGEFDPLLGALHMTAIFLAVYTAHVKDGYVDFYVRGEDDDHPLTARGCRLALLGSSLGFAGMLGALWLVVGPWAAALTLPGWLIGYHHAPQLDTNPVTTTTGYPLGIALAILGGFYVQTGTLTTVALAFAAVFLVLLSGVKVVDDAQDYDYDRSIEKRTVAVILGREGARRAAFSIMGFGLLGVLAFAAFGIFPPSAALAVVVFVPVAYFAYRGTEELATMLLVRGCYVFLAALLVAVYFEPLG